MDFEHRLQRAIERGEKSRDEKHDAQSAEGLSLDEYKDLYGRYRIDANDQIEQNLRQLADHFPGFRYQTVAGNDGWGARITRDDVDVGAAGRQNLYSRFELLVRPFNEKAKVVEVVVKGTIRNRETIARSHFQRLGEVDQDLLTSIIDQWVLEYAEQFAATS